MDVEEFEDRFGNPVFCLETNLDTIKNRLKNRGIDDFDEIFDIIQRSINKLKELKQGVATEGVNLDNEESQSMVAGTC